MTQEFTTTEVLRLEVEADAPGLVNLVQNPTGDLGGWGWVTPTPDTSVEGGPDGLTLRTTTTQATHAATEILPATPGRYIGARFVVAAVSAGTVTVRGRIVFLDAVRAVISSGAQTAAAGAGETVAVAGVAVPAGATYAQLRLDAYTAGGNLAADAWVRFTQVTVAESEDVADLGSFRRNLIPNPSFEVDTAGWTWAGAAGVRTNAQAASGSWSLAIAGVSSPGNIYYAGGTGTAGIPVEAGRNYTIQTKARAATVARSTVAVGVDWYDAAGTRIGGAYVGLSGGGSQLGAWTLNTATVATPPGAAFARFGFQIYGAPSTETHYLDDVMVELGDTAGGYFDGSTPDAAGVDYAWTGTAHNSASTATVAGALPYIAPTEWLNVLGPGHEIRVAREELNLGTVEGTILDAALDPSQADTLRPGRRLRLAVLTGDVWVPLFSGELRRAHVTYDPKDTTEKRARIAFTAVDNTATLGNHRRAEGVATIAELPYVLEGCGVPWNVNGSGNQVPAATVVAVNDNATAIDQVGLTRDSNLGRAWVDRRNVLNVWDNDQLPATVAATLDETVCSDLEVDYDTDRCINHVTVTVARLDGLGETVEDTFGPYLDAPSIATWGVRAQEFTVQWVEADEPAAAAFAAAVLAANATPTVRINAATLPIRTTEDLTDVAGDRRALLDLGDLVTASNANLGITSSGRIARLAHIITPTRWELEVEFATEGNVALPQATPAPPRAGAATLAQQLRPVGEVTAMMGLPSQVWPGWLVLNGAALTPGEYPDLEAWLAAAGLPTNVLPDLTDRLPVGAGIKALGAKTGAWTKTLTEAHLPAHVHTAGTIDLDSSSATGTSGARVARGTGTSAGRIGAGISGNTGNGNGTASPLDVTPPVFGLYWVIRARSGI